jgi:hypothetical protein
VGAALSASTGCGEDAQNEPEPEPPATCEGSEIPMPDGRCLRPGVPEDGCGEGFVHDGFGCAPVLPAEPCAPGTMALPGEEACRPVMPCGEGKWGDLPVDGNTVFVDGSYAGGDGDGSEQKPWPTIGEAVAAAAPGALVAVAAGSYAENVLIRFKPLRIWGVCPDLVEVVSIAEPAIPCPPTAICVLDGADGTEVGGLSLRGVGYGLVVVGSSDVLVDRVRVNDNAERGLYTEDSLGPTSVTLRGSLVESNRDIGVSVNAGAFVMEDSAIVGTLPNALNLAFGRGLNVQPLCQLTSEGQECNTAIRPDVIVRGSLIERNHDVNLLVGGANATIEDTAIRLARPQESDQDYGRGLGATVVCEEDPGGKNCIPESRASVTVTGSVVEQSYDTGVYVEGSDVLLERTTVRATAPRAVDQSNGRAMSVQPSCVVTPEGLQCDPATRGKVTLVQSLLEGQHEVGLFAANADVNLEGSVVRATAPRAADQFFGVGLAVQPICVGQATALTCELLATSSLSMIDSLIEEQYAMGVMIGGTEATITTSVVRTTSANAADGLYGDGIGVFFGASASLSAVRVDDSARGGVVSFGAPAALVDTHIRCAELPLVGEPYLGGEATLDDGGGNLCGCPAAEDSCKLVSASLEPPEALGVAQ